jgi:hypothetical protein
VKKLCSLGVLAILAACSSDPTDPSDVSVVSVAVSTPLTTITVGATVQLTANPLDGQGRTVSGAAVSWSSSSAAIASVSNTGLVTGVAEGAVTIRATAGGKTGEVDLTVDANRCTTPLSLAAGDVHILSGADAVSCITLAATTTPSDFLFVTANARPAQDDLVQYSVSLQQSALSNITSAIQSAELDPRVILERQAIEQRDAFETNLRVREREILDRAIPRLRGRMPANEAPGARMPSMALGAAVPVVGDTLTIRVPNAANSSPCTNFTSVRAAVKAVSQQAILVQDVAAPANGFTTSDYQAIGSEFDNLIYGTDTLWFGRPTDRNADGKIVVLYTPEVNKLTPQGSAGFTAGFFFGADVFRRQELQDAGINCPQTNEMEIFYLLSPDPTGTINSNVRTVATVRQNTRGTIAHELQHMISLGVRIFNPASKGTEVFWLNEAMSHFAEEAVGRAIRGFGDFQQLSFADVDPNPQQQDDYNAFFRQNLSRFTLWMQRPDTASPISARAASQLAPRGAGWALLRYAIDRYSGGNARALTRNLAAGPDTSIVNFRFHLGNPQFDDVISGWLVANFTDDLGVTNLNSRYSYTSWNMRDAMAKKNNNNFPLAVAPLPASQIATRSLSGSGNYFRLTRTAPAPQSTFRMTNTGGGTLSSQFARVYVVRLN